MKKTNIFFLAVVFTLISGISVYSQINVAYYGLHWEKGFNMNSRFGWINTSNSYMISDIAWPSLVAALCGWEVNKEKVNPVQQRRYFSIRGGLSWMYFQLDDVSAITPDISFDFLGVCAPPDSTSEYDFSGYDVYPLSFGISYVKAWEDRLCLIAVPSWGWAFARKNENVEKKTHKRIAVDIYIHYFLTPWFLLYGSVGYSYYPTGIPLSEPYGEGFGGTMITAGFAF